MKLLFSFGSIIDRLCIVAGAFFGSQIPQFIQQYSQRLAGHVTELHQLVDQLRKTASLSNKSLDQYIQKFLSSSDPDFVHQGHFMQGIVYRYEELNLAFLNLSQSTAWARPLNFIKGLKTDIAGSTFDSFQPGLNLNIEGLCYAGIGVIFGWAFYRIVLKLFRVLKKIPVLTFFSPKTAR